MFGRQIVTHLQQKVNNNFHNSEHFSTLNMQHCFNVVPMLEGQLIYISSPMLSIQRCSNVNPTLEGQLIYIVDIPSPMLSIQRCFNVVPTLEVQPT